MSFRNTEIGKLPSEWDVKTLKECSTKITDGTHSTVKDNKDGEYYLLSCKNVKNGNVVLGEKERKIDLDTLKKLRKRTNMDIGDLLLTTVGTIGESAIVKDLNFEFQRSVAIIKLDTKKVNKNFAYYITKDRYFKYQVSGRISGSVQKCLYLGDINNIKIPLPSLAEQKAIAKILSDLDEKIEVNNKINKNLEEMAQAIFKQWFVDFEFPNEEGKPYKSSGGEMVESELGMIPSDFSIINLNQLGKIITGKTPSTKNLENFGDEYMFITPKDVKGDMYVTNTERLLSEKGTEKLKNNKIQPNSIGVTCIGSNLGEVYINSKYIFTNQQINSLVLNEDRTYPYVYILLKNMKEEFLNIASGSAVPIINKSTFSNLKVILPNKNILNRFNEIMISNFEIIRNNLDENEILEKLRDTLLPKLMSGEIRVPLENNEN
ncbi:restriction endonuclease subunit S [Clostridium perfringens]|uniref:restriction endonuclease subunit S n=1 Tax=Clostridium perfringens TaxID=1502 RepID=UPI000B36D63B|nr:restriction endonuclease subunit S [Clostridium perfringens]MBI6017806.1 restriction endonuclease subunit S [Clostridium perfringens]MDG6888080.1 EcoKI restriction-modification system protein HsdS [Clostridium perfringens]MDK0540439.1 restriction endonuclease subunit S [Clostridium perfringens]MDK0670304.1 restriction endonuclease subunit S [Clostridium perfringens]MDM0498598.1 restriction endonuclease subunit S [Clostridium perfringens]